MSTIEYWAIKHKDFGTYVGHSRNSKGLSLPKFSKFSLISEHNKRCLRFCSERSAKGLLWAVGWHAKEQYNIYKVEELID